MGSPPTSRFRAGLALAAVLLLAGALRLVALDAGWFGVDQARDLAWGEAIASGTDFPWTGPLMRGRAHLGAAYYWFWAIPWFFTADPAGVYAFAALLGVAAVAGAYAIGARVDGPATGILAALLLATAPLAVIDARVAWAPAALPPLVAAEILLALAWRRSPSRPRACALMALAAAGTQLHLAAVPLLGWAGALVLWRWRRIGAVGLVFAALAAAVPLVPMAIAWRIDQGASGPVRGDVAEPEGAGPRPSGPGIAGPGSTDPVTVEPGASPANPAGESIAPPRDVHAGRLADVLRVGARVLDGLSDPATRPAAVDAWIAVESVAFPLVILAALIGLLPGSGAAGNGRARSAGDAFAPRSGAHAMPAIGGRAPEGGLALVASAFFVSLLAVLVLPAEAWSYYLDTTLAPGAVLLAATARRVLGSRPAFVAAGLVALCRAAGLAWWITSAHTAGVVPANLERLRLGGSDPAASAGRARLPTVATLRRAAQSLVATSGIPLDELWSRVHGAGFGDLDLDNGYFLRRAARLADGPAAIAEGAAPPDGRPATATAAAAPREALVVHRGDLPAAWTAGFSAPVPAGPLDVYVYAPLVRGDAAVLEGCGGGPMPRRVPPDPRRYGFGRPAHPLWPCREVVVRVPVEAAPPGIALRVVARPLGTARVTEIAAEPPGVEVGPGTGAAGRVLRLAPGAATVRVAMVLDGPGGLDLHELHGDASAADGSATR